MSDRDYPECSHCGRLVPAYASVVGVSTCFECVEGKLASQAAEIARLQAEVRELDSQRDAWMSKACAELPDAYSREESALLWRTVAEQRRKALMLTDRYCEHLHHEKRHRHTAEELCPVEAIVKAALGGGEGES